jgi:hypothetical protein
MGSIVVGEAPQKAACLIKEELSEIEGAGIAKSEPWSVVSHGSTRLKA